MGRTLRHYSPCIRRNVVCALYHERRRRRIPMTQLVDEILTNALKGTESWRIMEAQQKNTNGDGE